MDAAVVETHVSVVFFVGDHVYKLKKPVTFDFVDQSTREARASLCHREVELNRRLAPDIYEDVATIMGGDGKPCDHLVVMKRLPADRRLSTLVAAGDPRCATAIDDIAAVLARFHATARRSEAIDRCGTREAVLGLWRANFDQMQPFAGSVYERSVLARATELAESFLGSHGALFDERVEQGSICDGHGDLLADDIYVLDDGPRIIDCLEFADRLRFGDVVADLAFLAMDLERIGAASLATDLVAAYERHAGTTIPPSLLHLWIAYRAQVRSMVACLRSAQEDDADPDVERARALLDLCVGHLEDATSRVVVVGGLPGTGKSTVARGVGEALGYRVLSSDVVRKELAGIAATTRTSAPFGEGIYAPESTARTYEALLDRARGELEHGRSVILDASFIAGGQRDQVRRLATEFGATLVELRCALPAAEAHGRIQARFELGEDPSDADTMVAARMAELADPWPEGVAVSTSCSEEESVAAALAAVRGSIHPTP